METVNAFRMSRMILTAFELGIFDHLSGRNISSSALAGILGTDPRTTNRLLNALSGTGLVEVKNGIFSNSPFSEKFLVRNAPSFLGGMGHSLSMWKTWNTLTDAVKAGHAVADIVQNDINHRGRLPSR